MSPAIKTVKTHVFSATSPTAFSRKLKAAPTTLPMMPGSVSTAFPASLLRASANLSNHFLKVSLSFGGGPPAPTIENMVIPCYPVP